jgi:hypothetical protein
MSKAAELAALIGSQSALSNRNLIINGAMQVAQRGTSATGVTSAGSAYLVDRINYNISNAGTWTITQDSDGPDGFTKSFKALCTTADASLAASDFVVFYMNFEGQDFQILNYGGSSAETVTLSFYVKSNKTGTYQVNLRATDSATERNLGGTYTVDSANTWERKTITYVGDTAQAIVNSNARGNTLEFWVVAGTTFTSGAVPTVWEDQAAGDRAAGLGVNLADAVNNYWQITGVQLEAGEQATPFEHRSFGDELARCQRYTYIMSSNTSSTTTDFINGAAYSASQVNAGIDLPVTMRTTPTVTYGNTSGVAGSVQLRYGDGAFVKADAEL